MPSAVQRPEFFLDRALGVGFAQVLRADGWLAHRIADVFPNDAQDVTDEQWIETGSRSGWAMITKDQRIRYRSHELESLSGQIFCLANGNLTVHESARRFIDARVGIERAVALGAPGFWKVYEGGQIRRTWP